MEAICELERELLMAGLSDAKLNLKQPIQPAILMRLLNRLDEELESIVLQCGKGLCEPHFYVGVVLQAM